MFICEIRNDNLVQVTPITLIKFLQSMKINSIKFRNIDEGDIFSQLLHSSFRHCDVFSSSLLKSVTNIIYL